VHAAGGGPIETEVLAPMKVLIGVDPHKASVAVAAVDEAKGELLERASFPQDLEKALVPSSAGRNSSPSAALSDGERPWSR
jgi:hypothetical protein